jgi:hypothetical protein
LKGLGLAVLVAMAMMAFAVQWKTLEVTVTFLKNDYLAIDKE